MREEQPVEVEIVVQRNYRWLVLSCIGAILVTVGTFLPYVRLVSLSGSYVASRSDWQLGAHSSLTFFGAPWLLILVALVLIEEFAFQGYSLLPMKPFRFRNALLGQVVIGLALIETFVSTFPGKWTGLSDFAIQRGAGGYLSLLGIVLLACGVLREQILFFVTRKRNSNYRSPALTAYESKILDNFGRRRWIQFVSPLIGGAVFALGVKWISSGTWLTALIDFLWFSIFLGAQRIWTVRRLRKKRAELTVGAN
jgi:hypothetical protein